MSRSRIDWDAQPLGTVPDAVLARRLKVSATTVARHRKRRGIAISDDVRAQTRARRRGNIFRTKGLAAVDYDPGLPTSLLWTQIDDEET